MIWAAGVTASELAAKLADEAGLEVDRAGRIPVEPDLTPARGTPRCSRSATWSGCSAPTARSRRSRAWRRSRCSRAATPPARSATACAAGRRAPFRYTDKGNLATIGRSKAVADVKGLQLAGFPAWALWLVVHLFYLIGFQNRLLVAAPLDGQLRHARTRGAADRPDARSWRPRPRPRQSGRSRRGTALAGDARHGPVDEPAGSRDLEHERRGGSDVEGGAVDLDRSRRVDGDARPVVRRVDRLRARDDREAEVDAVAVEDPREAAADDAA